MSRDAPATMPPDPGRATPGPWYRDRWPWILILGPAVVVVAGIVTLVIAVESDDGLVADDYYKRGLAINQVIERGERAARLGVSAVVDVAPDGRVVVTLDGGGTDPQARPPVVRLWLAHPTRAGEDRAATLVRAGEGRYEGRVPPLPAGRWRVIVETDAWRLPGVEATAPVERLHLTSKRQSGG